MCFHTLNHAKYDLNIFRFVIKPNLIVSCHSLKIMWIKRTSWEYIEHLLFQTFMLFINSHASDSLILGNAFLTETLLQVFTQVILNALLFPRMSYIMKDPVLSHVPLVQYGWEHIKRELGGWEMCSKVENVTEKNISPPRLLGDTSVLLKKSPPTQR